MRRKISRRTLLSAVGAGAVGAAGVAVLAACGEAQKAAVATAAPAAPVATEAPKVVKEAPKAAAEAAKAPQAGLVQVRYVSDHTSGPRGGAMQWGLAEYAKRTPSILVKFEPQPGDYKDSYPLQMAAGTQAEVGMTDGGMLGAFAAQGGFTQINDVLAKRKDWKKEDYYFIPDTCTVNFDHTSAEGKPAPTVLAGPQFGVPFQGAVNGLLVNVTLGEQTGAGFPQAGWRYDQEFLEAAKKATNADKKTWGAWARQDYEFHYASMAYGWGAKAPRNAQETELILFDDGGMEGLRFSVDMIHKHKVSFTVASTQAVQGEFGDPFNSGNVFAWLSGRVYSSGFAVPRIKDRFKWSLAPMPVGPASGGKAIHHWNDQPNLITNAAQRLGTVEQAVDLVVFLGGPVYQGRVSIDRGHLPMFKAALDSPEAKTPPPEGMQWLKTYADTPNARHLEMALPNWWGMNEWRNTYISRAYTGDSTVEKAVEDAKAFVKKELVGQRALLNTARQKFGQAPLP
ncbi:MAG: hypothetical protein FJ029_04285 [Actinobacteria bacterium]|nr:hypothetical protein [Actinomycetota bacterium]